MKHLTVYIVIELWCDGIEKVQLFTDEATAQVRYEALWEDELGEEYSDEAVEDYLDGLEDGAHYVMTSAPLILKENAE